MRGELISLYLVKKLTPTEVNYTETQVWTYSVIQTSVGSLNKLQIEIWVRPISKVLSVFKGVNCIVNFQYQKYGI